MKIRVLIVDDEPLGRRAVQRLLAQKAEYEVIGEAEDGPAAVRAIRSTEPDLVFLDVEMPGMTGFEVISEVGVEEMPGVVFVTAYSDFAARAFEEDAIDYVVKPLSEDRFFRSLDRARSRLRHRSEVAALNHLLPLLGKHGSQARFRERIVVRDGSRLEVVRTPDILWIETDQNYLVVQTAEKKYRLREKLSAMEEMLDPERFVRVHRSTIVNVDQVQSLSVWSPGEFVLQMRSGAKLPTGRTYKERVREVFGC